MLGFQTRLLLVSNKACLECKEGLFVGKTSLLFKAVCMCLKINGVLACRAARDASFPESLLAVFVSVSAMLVYIHQKNIAQVFILERCFFVSVYPAASHGTCLAVFLVAVLLLC